MPEKTRGANVVSVMARVLLETGWHSD